MPQTINTNTISLNAQRNLNSSQATLATSMQRLSSGLRVNSAKDDAAGLAIAERMNTQVRGLNVAARNANDGISLAQTAEGALGKISDMLQRMRELAVQAGNATNSKDDRKALQNEVSQLRDEIDRVAKQTTFNGRKLLDGSFAAATFQIGANSGDAITIGSLADATGAKMSSVNFAKSLTEDLDLTDVDTLDAIDAGTLTIQTSGMTDAVDLGKIDKATSAEQRLGQVVEAINRKSNDTGVTAFLTKNDDGTYNIELMSGKLDADGVPEDVTLSGFSTATTGLDDSAAWETADDIGSVDYTTGIDTLSVETQADVWVALKKIDSALDQINGSRATLGAVQSRFETAVSNIATQVENLTASRGRIMDADFAQESANLSRAQILQQAGTAMVAQANQLPQQVLQLLKG